MDENLLTTSEFAEIAGVTRRTVQRWISEGLIFAVKIGRGYKIPSDELPPYEATTAPQEEYEEEEREEEEEEFEPERFEQEADGDPEEDDPDFENPYDVEVESFDKFDDTELRRIQATLPDAVRYANDIPLPSSDISIIVDPALSLYRVRVNYTG